MTIQNCIEVIRIMYLKICLNILQVPLSIPMRLGNNYNLEHLVRVKKKHTSYSYLTQLNLTMTMIYMRNTILKNNCF